MIAPARRARGGGGHPAAGPWVLVFPVGQSEGNPFPEIFMANPEVDARRGIIPSLDLGESPCPEGHRPRVARAMAIARGSGDDDIRHRVEVQPETAKVLISSRIGRSDRGKDEMDSAVDGVRVATALRQTARPVGLEIQGSLRRAGS